MTYKRDKRIDGEYDPPLPERNENISEADKEKLAVLIEKYKNMARQKQTEKYSKLLPRRKCSADLPESKKVTEQER